MTDPREWSCTDDSPLNNGWGYNAPEPEEDNEDIPDEDFDDDKNISE